MCNKDSSISDNGKETDCDCTDCKPNKANYEYVSPEYLSLGGFRNVRELRRSILKKSTFDDAIAPASEQEYIIFKQGYDALQRKFIDLKRGHTMPASESEQSLSKIIKEISRRGSN